MRRHAPKYLSQGDELKRMRLQHQIDGPIRPLEQPVALLALFRPDDAAALMLTGLRQHYLPCLAGGRLPLWAAAAHATIDLLASVPDVRVVKRSELETVLAAETAEFFACEDKP